jgi:hypothetical protein
MATIRRELSLEVGADDVWSALRDVGAVHTRLARGFVVDCRLEGDARIVTFANGMVAREVIVDIGDASKRLVYSVRSEQLTHHNGAFEVIAEGPKRSRVIWLVDLLPKEMAGPIAGMMDQGCTAMKKTLEAS